MIPASLLTKNQPAAYLIGDKADDKKTWIEKLSSIIKKVVTRLRKNRKVFRDYDVVLYKKAT
jgi:predicted glycosyltransferase